MDDNRIAMFELAVENERFLLSTRNNIISFPLVRSVQRICVHTKKAKAASIRNGPWTAGRTVNSGRPILLVEHRMLAGVQSGAFFAGGHVAK
jgi:hypothetical protein